MATRVNRRTLLTGAAAAAILPFLPARAQAPDDPAARLRALIDESDRARRALDPLGSSRDGVAATGPAFVDPLGEEHGAWLRGNAERDEAGLRAIDRNALGRDDRIAFDVFRYRTAQTLDRHRAGLFAVQQKAPLNPSFGFHVEFADYAATAGPRLATPIAQERFSEQLRGFATYLQSLERRLRQGIADGYHQSQVTTRAVIAQLDAMLALPVERSPLTAAAATAPEPQAAAWRRIVGESIYPACRSLRDFLAQTYLPAATQAPGRWAMKDGAALYAADLANHTTTAMSAEDIHAIGLAEVARIREDMERTRRDIGFGGDLPAFFEHIRTDPRFYYREPEALIRHFAEIEARIWQGMPRLFSRRPRAPFEVRGLPAVGEQRGTGYYSAGPADGSGPGILYFNMAMLGTRPIPTLETLTLHEGIPGHHYQISLVQEDTGLPPILRFGRSTAYSEGWGLYAESLGRELGLFTDPYQWFGHLDMEMLRAVRLVVDTGLHALRWDRQRAIDYMLANTSMAARDVAVEIDRYISVPGQACAYKIGELKLQELRRTAAARLGAAFDIRAFHDQILNTGAMPLAVLEAKIGGWIEGRG